MSGRVQADSGKAGETMGLVQSEATVGTVTHRTASVGPATTGVGVLHCLVASAETARQRLFAQSAQQWGWETTVCNNSADAQWAVARMCTQLAFVDLEGEQGAGFQPLVRQLADQRQVLLVVCGHEQDGVEEVWARQLGVWFYLPGICELNTIGLLCRDARSIVAQRTKAAEQDVSPVVPK
jgi:DNA-binding NtrC family response regulator